jgi:hypothetical protein
MVKFAMVKLLLERISRILRVLLEVQHRMAVPPLASPGGPPGGGNSNIAP